MSAVAARACCSMAEHAALKLDARRWLALPFLGLQDLGDGTFAEARNCSCGSTLLMPLERPAGVEGRA